MWIAVIGIVLLIVLLISIVLGAVFINWLSHGISDWVDRIRARRYLGKREKRTVIDIPDTSEIVRFCRECGQQLEEQAQYCDNCGTKQLI